LDVGSEFDLYGRRWRIDRMIPPDPWHPRASLALNTNRATGLAQRGSEPRCARSAPSVR